MPLRPAPLAFALAALAGGVALAAAPDAAGRWTGIAIDSGPHYRIERPVDLTIAPGTDGALTIVDGDRMRGNAVPGSVVRTGNHVSASYKGLWPTPIMIEGDLSPDGRTLSILMRGDGMTGLEEHRAVLRRGDVPAAAFAAPRLDSAGRHATVYRYRQPRDLHDGLGSATPEAVGLARAPLEAMVAEILRETGDRSAHQTESILVLRHGKLVFEEYFWGQSAANPHIISSATKSITSILVGAAFDDGKLALDRPVAGYFPDRADRLWVKDAYPITVRNMLAMSSGTSFDSSSTGPGSFGLLSTRDVTDFSLDTPAIHPAGTVYNYDNSLPSLAGALAAKVEGRPFVDLAADRLFAPLYIVNYRWTDMPEGVPLAAGGLYLRSRDMAKIGQMMLQRGQWRGKRILSEQWVAESARKQTARGQYPYGFYWHLNNAEKRRIADWDGYMALGQGGQVIGIFPDQDIVVVMTSADWASKTVPADAPFDLISRFVVSSLADAKP